MPAVVDISAIKQFARQLGFQLVGVTTPDPPPHLDAFTNWLAAGRHGQMAYLAAERSRQRRADPREILPECRSILVLGIRYPTSTGGHVASYALGDDYHEILPERLRALVSFIEAQAGEPVPNRYYTDTGPILERDLAQRAGLGWIGKNTTLINPQGGSYYLLAEILLGIELAPDPPFISDLCGSCTRCLEACPTQCILPDRTLDARACISYLTIELKDAIPLELRPQIGEWAFGCDVCQQVCPWNVRFAPPGDEADQQAHQIFAPRRGIVQLDLRQELALTPESFSQKFKLSPVKRARRRGYLRNVAVALGNQSAGTGDPSAVQALAQALLNDAEPLVRRHAAWALGRVGGAAARQALEKAARREADEEVRKEIEQTLTADFKKDYTDSDIE